MLTDSELEVLHAVGYDQAVGALIRSHTTRSIERAKAAPTVFDDLTDAQGVSLAVRDGGEAEQLFNAMQDELIPLGFRSFWSRRHHQNGLSESDELVILKTADDMEIIRFRHTDGANYGITTDDILERLKSWREFCSFHIVGADSDFVVLQFDRLPERLCDFASEINEFCPDAAAQGVGVDPRFNTPEKVAASQKLCPEVNAKAREMPQEAIAQLGEDFMDLLLEDLRKNIRLLALKLRETSELFLWWD